MKYSVKYLSLLLACLFVFYSCDEEIIEYSEINLEVVDGFLNAITSNVPFVAGTESYGIEVLVVPGVADVTEVRATIQFNDAGSGSSSEEIAFRTYGVDAGEASTLITDLLTYADLREGLTVDGDPLPTAETDVTIGSFWTIRLTPVNAAGDEAGIGTATINVAVLSPFAGDYEVYESGYFRIEVESGLTDWTGQVNFIGSVNATTYSHPDWWGPFAYPGSFKFIVREDNTIWIPKVGEVEGVTQELFSGNYILNCEDNAGAFNNVPCAGSNVLEPSEDGKHIIKLTYGYYTASGDENEGEREFYEFMEKIVD